MRKSRTCAKFLAIIVLALTGLSNGSALQLITRPAIAVAAGESNTDGYLREGGRPTPNRWARSKFTTPGVNSRSAVSALPEPDDSTTQTSAPAANGKIAFTRSLQIAEVQVMNADGSNRINLTNSQGFDGAPAWSPDGSKIAFASDRGGNSEIYVMRADGSSPMQLTNDPAEDSEPTWSPDGTRIAFTRNDSIYVMNADGSNPTRLINGPWWSNNPAWSPDGTRIAFTSGRPEPDDGIYVMNADGSNQTKLTSSLGADSQPDWSPDGSRIAFASTRDGSNFEIYVMNADGSNPTRLTNNSQFDGEPAWSPDNTKIAFTSYVDGDQEIYVMNADGSNRTRITNNPVAWDGSPHWSPDGVRIVYTTFQSFRPEIYVMNSDGSNLQNLTNNPADDYSPAWSPDGARIAFTSDRDGNPEIYVMNADGSNQINLTKTNYPLQDGSPAWSPDGTKIAFTRTDTIHVSQIYVMNADGSNQTRLTDRQFGSLDPAWSPDGNKIAFGTLGLFGDWDFITADEIYVMNADGSNQINLTNNPGFDSQPAWSPDGARIAFTRVPSDTVADPLAEPDIYVMNADGSNQIRLTNNAAADSDPAWSPDGTRIAFLSDRHGNGGGNTEIYVMNADGGSPTRLTNNLDAGNGRPAWQSLLTPTFINAVDDPQFFVRQHYLDFLNREPDPDGLAYWTNRITDCGSDSGCINERRIGVSAAFFVEMEFQETGYYIYRFYKASFGRQPSYAEFSLDRSLVSGGSNLEANKQAFADDWVQRPAFVAAYPIIMTNTEVVNKLFDSAGLTASIYDALRQQEILALNAGRSRALVLRDVIEIPDFKNIPDPNDPRYSQIKQTSQYNPAFVLMQYFGYLRRGIDQDGYNFWLDVVNNREPNNYGAMVCAFITSSEYQLRFGSVVTRSNADCAQ
jgi:Tol biopolymer transport system component